MRDAGLVEWEGVAEEGHAAMRRLQSHNLLLLVQLVDQCSRRVGVGEHAVKGSVVLHPPLAQKSYARPAA